MRLLHNELNANTQRYRSAQKLAHLYVRRAREEGNHRYIHMAESVLAPWWEANEASTQILLLRAYIKQSNHRLEDALADINQALRQSVRHPSAWVTKATILLALARYEEVRTTAIQMLSHTSELASAAIAASLGSLTGQQEESLKLIENVIHRTDDSSNDERAWACSIAAEIAERCGQFEQSEKWFMDALDTRTNDTFLINNYTDFLIRRKRPDEALSWLEKTEITADSLLRRAIARRTKNPEDRVATAICQTLEGRFKHNREAGYDRHLRIEARFYLELANDPHHALDLAKSNWDDQKEPIDACLLLSAAKAAGDLHVIERVSEEIRGLGMNTPETNALLRSNAAPTKAVTKS